MASTFSNSFWGVETSPRDLENYRRKYKIKRKFDIACLVGKLHTKIPKNPIFGIATTKNTSQSFAGLSILTLKINFKNLKSMSKKLAILQNNL